MKKKLQLPNLPKQTMIAIALAVGGLLVGVMGYVVAVSPEKGKIAPIDSQIASARASLISAEEAPAKIKPVPAKAADLFRLTKAMPDSDDIPGVLIDLAQLAKDSKVELQGVTPTADVAESGYSEVPLSVTVVGSYREITNFLADIHHAVSVSPDGNTIKANGRLFVTTAVTLASPDGSSVSGTITLDAFTYGTTASATSTTGTDTTATTTTTG